MPNRGELATPAVRAAKNATATAGDAWSVIGFCAVGWLLSICAAILTFGAADALPRLMAEFSGTIM